MTPSEFTLYVLFAATVLASLVLELSPSVLMMSGALIDPSPLDRLQKAFNKLSRVSDPRRTFFGFYEYAVQGVSSDGTTVDATPTDTTLSLPGIVQIPVRLPVATAKVATGQRVIVYFVNGDPTRPAVMSSDPVPTVATFDASTTINLGPSAQSCVIAGGGATAYVLRHGDSVQLSTVTSTGSWPGAGAISSATLILAPPMLVNPGPPSVGHSKAVA